MTAASSVACSSLTLDSGDNDDGSSDSQGGASSSSGGSNGLGGAEAIGGDAAGGDAAGGSASNGTGGENTCTKIQEDEHLALSSSSELLTFGTRLSRGPNGTFVSVGTTRPTLQSKPVGVLRRFSGDVEDWTREIQGLSNDDELFGAAFDAAGNIYVVGSTSGALGDGDNAGAIDAFVRKYDAHGNVAWTRQFGTALFDKYRDVAVHGDALYVVGYSDASEEDGWTNAFVEKFELDGDLVWTRDVQTEWVDTLYRVVVNEAGDVYVLGDTGGELDGSSAGMQDAYLRKYTADGDVVWTRQFGGSSFETPTGLALDVEENVIVSGFGNDLDGHFWGFVAKYDASGTQSWFHNDISDWTYVGGVGADTEGNIYVGTYHPGEAPTATRSGIHKLTPNGEPASTHRIGTTFPTTDVLVVGVDDFYFTGTTFLVHSRPVCATDN